MEFWYALFVKTGYEQIVVDWIDRFWQFGVMKSFVPQYGAYFRKAGQESVKKRCLIPGYVFIETDISDIEFAISARKYINRSNYALKLMRYGGIGSFQYSMMDDERDFITELCRKDLCAEMSTGFIEGDRVVVTEGALIGFESRIKKINRHKREATIEIEMMGDVRQVVIGLEIVNKL